MNWLFIRTRQVLQGRQLLLLILLISGITAGAQTQRTVSGRVTDSVGRGLQSASVVLQGTTIGTTTAADGSYTLSFPEANANRRLVVTYLGLAQQEIVIGNQQTINVTLRSEAGNTLEDIVVVGYGTQRRVSVTGAVDKVTSQSIERKPVTSVLQALQGESPNLIIQQTNFNPGSGVTINIRGLGTLGNNTPLIVIDGIIGGDINSLNPNDIESVSVLKDAGAAAIYGSRSANGVLLVTTKSGRLNQKPTVSYNGAYGIQNARVLVEKVSAWDNAYYKNEALVNSGLAPAYTPDQIQALKDQGNGTWDVEHLLRNAPIHLHNLSVSGGGESSAYFLSAGYQSQLSNLIGNGGSGAPFGYQKYNLRLNQTANIGRFRANLILSYVKTRNKTNSVGDNNIFADANRVPLNYSWKDSAGNYLTNPVAAQYNEYGVLEKGGWGQSDNDEIFANINGQFNITKNLKLTAVFGGTINNYSFFYRRLQVNYQPAGVYGDDRAVLDNSSKTLFLNSQVFAEYTKRFDAHSFKLQAGATNESNTGRGFQLQKLYTDPFLGTSTTGTTLDAVNSNNSIGIDQSSLNSIIGRLNYSFLDRYFFEATFRNDISSRFAAGNRSAFFPALSGAWVASQESFFQPLSRTINNLKFRATYGVLGNQNVGAYQYQATYFNYPAAYGFGNTGSNTSIVGGAGFILGNPDLTWEKAATLNLGVDASLFANKLTLSFDYFDKTTSDILLPRQDVPRLFGAGLPDYNVAKVKSRGWEFSGTYNLRGRNVTQSFSVNVADNTNQLLALSNDAKELVGFADVFSLLRRVGQPITQYYGYKTAGYFQSTDDIAKYARPVGSVVAPGDVRFVDQNNDGVIDEKDKVTLGYPFPRYTFGFTYRLAIKGFDLQLFVQGVGKRDAFLRGELVEPYHYNYGNTMYKHLTDYWTPSNPDARYPRLAVIGSASNANNWRQGSDLYKYDAAYARLKNVAIGYTLPQSMTRRWGIQRLKVSLVGQNLVTLSKLDFIDPETSEFGNNLNIYSSSNSARAYPLPVYYGANLEINF